MSDATTSTPTDAVPKQTATSTATSNALHVLKFNAGGVWSNVLVPIPPGTSTAKPLLFSTTVEALSSDLCLGLASPQVRAMNCQPGNPVAFLTLMWNASRNMLYFLNLPLKEPTAQDSNHNHGLKVKYFAAKGTLPVLPVPQTKFTLEVDLKSRSVKGHRDGTLCFELAPTPSMMHTLGKFRFGIALSGAAERVQLSSPSVPVNPTVVLAKRDTLAFGLTAETTRPPKRGTPTKFEPVAVTVESVLPNLIIDKRYEGASKRRQRIDINESYPGLTKVHSDPDIFEIHDFLTPEECQRLQVRNWPIVDALPLVRRTIVQTSLYWPGQRKTLSPAVRCRWTGESHSRQ